MSPIERIATQFNTVVGILVFGIFAWKAAEMALKEHYSKAWGLLFAGALVGGFLFAGRQTFTWLWGIITGIAGS